MSQLLVITPVHNEEPHIQRVVEGMLNQQRPPDLWIIVDDQSSDDTFEIALRATRDVDWAVVVTFDRPPVRTPDRLACALEASSFNYGLGVAGGSASYDYVAKLDGDVVLPPDYYAACLSHLEEHPEVGLVCGQLVETVNGSPRVLPIASSHVHGALKLYRRECFEAIGGMADRLGWDAIDEIYARMHGFVTRSLPEPVAQHRRPVGTADGLLRGRARHGTVAYITHFPWYWVLGRSLKIACARPRGLSGVAFLAGYARAAVTGAERVDDPAFRRFARRELLRRTRGIPAHALRRLDERPRVTARSAQAAIESGGSGRG